MPIQGVTTSDLVCIREFIEAKTAEAPAADAKSHEMGMGLLQSYLDWLTKAKDGENEEGGEQLEGGSEQLEGGGEQFSSESSEEDKGSNASSCQPGKRTQFRVSSSTLYALGQSDLAHHILEFVGNLDEEKRFQNVRYNLLQSHFSLYVGKTSLTGKSETTAAVSSHSEPAAVSAGGASNQRAKGLNGKSGTTAAASSHGERAAVSAGGASNQRAKGLNGKSGTTAAASSHGEPAVVSADWTSKQRAEGLTGTSGTSAAASSHSEAQLSVMSALTFSAGENGSAVTGQWPPAPTGFKRKRGLHDLSLPLEVPSGKASLTSYQPSKRSSQGPEQKKEKQTRLPPAGPYRPFTVSSRKLDATGQPVYTSTTTSWGRWMSCFEDSTAD
jgi:hypothetical protein